MLSPQRNQLVWLSEQAWRSLLCQSSGGHQPFDACARAILQHWSDQQLPLVVTAAYQAVAGKSATNVALGLPAPTQWQRRKLAIQANLQDLLRVAEFPELAQLGQVCGQAPGMLNFAAEMRRHGVAVQVYGSHGWQHLTGLHYLREGSDLDLRFRLQDSAQAAPVIDALQRLTALALPWRIDGELAFTDGQAVAWREVLQWQQGAVSQVLVKSRRGAELRCWPLTHADTPAEADAGPAAELEAEVICPG